MTGEVWRTEDIKLALAEGLGIEDIRVATGLSYQIIAERLPEGDAYDAHCSIAWRYALHPPAMNLRKVA